MSLFLRALTLALVTQGAAAQELSIRVELPRGPVESGRRFTLVIVRQSDRVLEPEPFDLAGLQPLRLRAAGLERSAVGESLVERLSFDAWAFSGVPLNIAPLVFRARNRVSGEERVALSEATHVDIVPALTASDAREAELPGTLLPIPERIVVRRIALGSLALLTLSAGGLLVRRQLRRRLLRPTAAGLTPVARARWKIEKLRHAAADGLKTDELAGELAAAVREAWGEGEGAPLLAMSAEEVRSRKDCLDGLDPPVRERIADLLAATDQAVYGLQEVGLAARARLIEVASELVGEAESRAEVNP